MSLYQSMLERLRLARHLRPKNVKRLTDQRLEDLIDAESVRAKRRLAELQQRYPSAANRELAQRMVDAKKNIATMVGGITGVFGAVTVPVDLVGMVYLQLSLLVDVATVFRVNLKPSTAKRELLDLFGYANGIGPVQRASPKVLGSLVALVLSKTGLTALGRAMPFVAAPISAWLNNQHVQRVGDAAVRHYEGWFRAHEKSQRASGV